MINFGFLLAGCILCMEGNSNGKELRQWKNIPWKKVNIFTEFFLLEKLVQF